MPASDEADGEAGGADQHRQHHAAPIGQPAHEDAADAEADHQHRVGQRSVGARHAEFLLHRGQHDGDDVHRAAADRHQRQGDGEARPGLAGIGFRQGDGGRAHASILGHRARVTPAAALLQPGCLLARRCATLRRALPSAEPGTPIAPRPRRVRKDLCRHDGRRLPGAAAAHRARLAPQGPLRSGRRSLEPRHRRRHRRRLRLALGASARPARNRSGDSARAARRMGRQRLSAEVVQGQTQASLTRSGGATRRPAAARIRSTTFEIRCRAAAG